MAPGDEQKRAVAVAAAELARDGMRLGLGTGSTVAHLLPALAARGLRDVRCVATSLRTEREALALGLPVEPFDALDRLDLAIDGADQVAPDRWLVKGGGGAHLREKVVAAAAERFVVIVSADKLVDALDGPVPLELLPFGLAATSRAVGDVRVRAEAPRSPDGGVIADRHGPVGDPAALARALDATPGVLAHGLFAPEIVAEVLVGEPGGVRRGP
jgi:ribose 5-phosphate isomerase A